MLVFNLTLVFEAELLQTVLGWFPPTEVTGKSSSWHGFCSCSQTGASLKTCMQLVYSTRRRSEPALSTETAKSRGYNKSTEDFLRPKEDSLKLISPSPTWKLLFLTITFTVLSVWLCQQGKHHSSRHGTRSEVDQE